MTISSGHALETLWEDGEFLLSRGVWDGEPFPVLGAAPSSAQPSPETLARLQHAYTLREELDPAWAARPLKLEPDQGRLTLLIADPGGEPLSQFLERPWEIPSFLRVAISLANALGRLHERGLIHKDIKPANILVKAETGEVWLTGFGIASRLPRERQAPAPPELIAGTLAYMAPEQTGRMNRSVDARSDLYALGVTFYEMLTATLPFTAADPMEWVHCHIARQPAPPNKRVADVPGPLSAIVMKLLAKSAEERYQTAVGVEADLRVVLAEWELHGRIKPFPLGAHDLSDQLLIPEKLYGRRRKIDTLLAAFDRVAANGAPELVLVTGYAGVGKSSLVNELHKALVPARGLFASGKFDQYKRDIPYATLAQAFQSLVRHILGKGKVELDQWRDALQAALGANGGLIVNLVPELELVIGKQPPVPNLLPQDAKNRFQLVFRRFLSVFAREEHPLALFLDDLQWLDAATLDLIEHLVTHSEVRRLLLVAAYRDNEVGPTHPLLPTLDAIRNAGASVHEIVLAPLRVDAVGQLVADALHCPPARARPLAKLVHEKTRGNPFFAIQFITGLAEEGLLAFDPVAPAWRWDIDRIRARGYTDNVVDLMVGKLKRLSSAAQDVLKHLACLGNIAEAATLAMVCGQPETAMRAALSEAAHAGLVLGEDSAYKFLHDRIQQAAYSLIPVEDRADVHLGIGRVLLSCMTADELGEHLFDVASQLNRGAGRLNDRHEKAQVATIDLRSGRKAKAAAAYATANVFLAAGMTLLDETFWASHYELMFSLRLERAACEFLSGEFDIAEHLLAELLERGTSKVDLAAAYTLFVELHIVKSQNEEAVADALTCLRLFDIDLPARPSWEQVQAEYGTIWQTLDGSPIESLIDLPLMTNPELRAATQLLSVLAHPAYFTDLRLFCLVACRAAKVGMQHGMCDASALGFAFVGMILGPAFHRHKEGYRFAKLACDVADKHGFKASRATVYHGMALASVWTQPIATAINFQLAAFRTATETGELIWACYSISHYVTNLLLRNDPLDAAWCASERSLDFAQKAGFQDAAASTVTQQRFIATMRGQTATFSSFSDAQFHEASFEAHLAGNCTLSTLCLYWIFKLQSRFLSGDYAEALAASHRAKALLWAAAIHIQQLDYHYYSALTIAALYEQASPDQQNTWREILTAHQEQLCEWADNYPPTFADKHALVSAEIARLEGRDAEAMRLYEQAIRSAREHGFVKNEGEAFEVAARFYLAGGFETFANAYLRSARHCYLRWGANGKVKQLDRLYPQMADADGGLCSSTPRSPVQQLDLASVIKASQAVSSEIELPKLIERLMTIALENAGADRGLLILPAEDDHLIQAEAWATADQVEVVLRETPITGIACPESVVRYAIRTRESVILNDASKQSLFSEDEYLRLEKAKSILSIPLVKQGRLTGLLYLENGLTSHAFPPERIAILELLAAQAAISLENTRLYNDLQEREAKVRRLVESDIIGICIWDFQGRIVEANEAYLRMVGYSHDDFVSGRLRWTALTPAEWRHADERALAELRAIGTCKAFEKEHLRKDGSRVPVLVGAATLGGPRDQGVAFVLDLTERKQAETQARESERRYREVEMQLAHASRVATLGQLTASIAHEVNQPITAAVTNAQAALRWLHAQPPNLNEVEEALGRVVRDGARAGSVVGRIRALIKKAPPRDDSVEIDATIREVIELTRSEAVKNGVLMQTELAEGLPLVPGDRVELQQVILNLILNALEATSAMSEGPRELRIDAGKTESGEVLIAVRDTGPGLGPAALEHVFQPFHTTKPNGLGLGLSICRSIVEARGGRLWASANSPRGAVFQFTWPAHPKIASHQ